MKATAAVTPAPKRLQSIPAILVRISMVDTLCVRHLSYNRYKKMSRLAKTLLTRCVAKRKHSSLGFRSTPLQFRRDTIPASFSSLCRVDRFSKRKKT